MATLVPVANQLGSHHRWGLGSLDNVFEWLKGKKRGPKLQLPTRDEKSARNQGEVDFSRFAPTPRNSSGSWHTCS